MFIKFLKRGLTHRDMKYKEGLNEDSIEFNPTGSCRPGGLYYTDFNHFFTFMHHGELIADIEVPHDAKIYPDPAGNKWKANKLIVNDIRPIRDVFKDKSDQYISRAIACEPRLMCYVHDINLQLSLVRSNGMLLGYIKNKTPELCLEAVKQNGMALEWISTQTEKICLAAVRQNGLALIWVKNKTSDICLAAVMQNWQAMRYTTIDDKPSTIARNVLAFVFVRPEIIQA